MKQIPNFPGYYADTDGNIYSCRSKNGRGELIGEPRKLRLTKRYVYNAVMLYKDGKQCMRNVSVLVLQTFVSERPNGMFACHGIKGRENDSLKNLYWGTPKQNVLDKKRDGTFLFGETHPRSRFNEFQIRIIRRLYLDGKEHGVSQQYIANLFNTAQSTIANIVYRKTWVHIV